MPLEMEGPNRVSRGRAQRVTNAAKLLGVSPRTVRYWAATGILPAHRRGPKMWFFYESDLARCLSSEAWRGDRSASALESMRDTVGQKYPATSAIPATRIERNGDPAR
jgi:excisionase family DNA binding protein